MSEHFVVGVCSAQQKEHVERLALSVGLSLGTATSNDHLWIACRPSDELNVIGFVSVRHVGDELEIRDVGVRASARRKGVARALVRRALQFATEMRVRAVFLEVARGNQPAVQLYQQVGFRTLNVRRRYYRNGDDALVMIFPFDRSLSVD